MQNVAVIGLLSTTTIIVPLSYNDQDVHHIANYISMSSLVLFVLNYIFVMLFVVRSITQLFSKSLVFFEKRRQRQSSFGNTTPAAALSKEEIDAVRDALELAGDFRNQSLGFCVLIIAAMLLGLAMQLRYVYLFFGIVNMILYVGMIPLPLLFLATEGGFFPKHSHKHRVGISSS